MVSLEDRCSEIVKIMDLLCDSVGSVYQTSNKKNNFQMVKNCKFSLCTEGEEWGESPLFLPEEELTAKISISK